MTDRSPNATKEEMQQAIDILRARGDSAIEYLYVLRDTLRGQVTHLDAYMTKLEEVDKALNIDAKARRDNAITTARRLLGKIGEGKSDEEVLKMVGRINEV